jgi:hypothetical protein
MMAPAISSVVALEPYVVRVVFVDGEVRDVDIEPLLDGPVLATLRDRDEFRGVAVDGETGVVAWPNGADLDSEVVYGIAPAGGAACRPGDDTPARLKRERIASGTPPARPVRSCQSWTPVR